MYHVGQDNSAPPRQPGESRWLWWILPAAGAFAGDWIGAGKLRPLLVLPHTRWRQERRGRIGAAIGAVAGIAAALAITRGDFAAIPPEVI